MNVQNSHNEFEEIYANSYNQVLRYVICKCQNLDDVNDIIQDTYVELYKIMSRKDISKDQINTFIKGIANNKVKKYYSIMYKLKNIITTDIEKEKCILESIPDDIDFQDDIFTKDYCEQIWQYIKRKEAKVQKIFILYYAYDMKIKEIANEINVSESYVKNCIYRTIKEIKTQFVKDGENHEN